MLEARLATTDAIGPVLAARAKLPLIERVRDELAPGLAVLPMLTEEPVGADRLRDLARGSAACGQPA